MNQFLAIILFSVFCTSTVYGIEYSKLCDLALVDLQQQHESKRFISADLKSKIENFDARRPLRLDILFLVNANEGSKIKMERISAIISNQRMRLFGSSTMTVGAYKIAQVMLELRSSSDANFILSLFQTETAVFVEESNPSSGMIEL